MTVEVEPTQPSSKQVVDSQPVTGLDPNKLDAFRKSFDVELAAREGLTDYNVVEYIREYFPEFDYDSATNLQMGFDAFGQEVELPGYTDREIVQFFTSAGEEGPTEAALKETARGFVKSLPIAAGTATGILAGSPLGLPGMVLGAGYGIYSGYKAGETLDKALFDPGVYAPSVRPFGEAGLTFGSSLGFIPAPHAYVGLNPGVIQTIKNISSLSGRTTPLEKMVKTTVDRPLRTGVAETTAAGGAAYGAMLAESEDPGNTALRMTYELGLGVFSPVSIGANLLEAGYERGAAAFSRKMRETRQGRSLIKWMQKNAPIDPNSNVPVEEQRKTFVRNIYQALSTEDDLKKVARELGIDENNLPTRTTAATLDIPLLYGLQAKLGLDPNDGARIKKAIERDYQGVQNLIGLMYGSGDPNLIAQAAKMREDFYTGLIIKRLDQANIQAAKITKNIPPTKIVNGEKIPNPRAAMEASEKIETLTGQALKDAREYESKLYEKIDKSETLSISNFEKQFEDMQQELADNESIAPIIAQTLFNKAKGKPLQASEEVSQLQNKLDRRIKNAEESIAKVNSSYPQSVEAATLRIDEDTTLEAQLSQIQDELRYLENTPTKDLDIKGPEKNRQINVLKSKSQIIDARLSKNDLGRMEPASIAPEEITLGEAMRVRSVLLNQARQATASGRVVDAHFLSDLADALRDDFGVASRRGSEDSAELTANQIALGDAFAFSSSLNDVFTRAFPGSLLAKSKTGARKILPELAYKSTFSGGGDATSLKYEQLDDAVRFAAEQTGKDFDDTVFSSVRNMRSAQEELLRSKLEDLVDMDGNITEQSLFAFNKKYRNVFFDRDGNSRFPELTESLSNLQDAQRTVKLMRNREEAYQTALNNSIVFSKLPLMGTNPEKIIGDILGVPGNRMADDPTGAFIKLIRTAKSADIKRQAEGQETGAVQGLKDMVFERGWSNASGINPTTGKDTFNFRAFADYLTEPLKKGKDGLSPLAIMEREGVLNSAEATRLAVILREGKKAQGQRALAETADAVEEPGGVTRGIDIMVRLVGLRAGRKATQMAPGQGQGLAEPMMIANEFSALLNIPRLAHRDILLEAIENPEMFKLLMERANQAGSKGINLRKKFNNFLLGSGFIGAEDYKREQERRNYYEQIEEQKKLVPEGFSASLERSPVAPTVGASAPEPRPFVVAQLPVAQQPPAQTTADSSGVASSPQMRARYKRDYPNDIVSSLIPDAPGQGIESLLG